MATFPPTAYVTRSWETKAKSEPLAASTLALHVQMLARIDQRIAQYPKICRLVKIKDPETGAVVEEGVVDQSQASLPSIWNQNDHRARGYRKRLDTTYHQLCDTYKIDWDAGAGNLNVEDDNQMHITRAINDWTILRPVMGLRFFWIGPTQDRLSALPIPCRAARVTPETSTMLRNKVGEVVSNLRSRMLSQTIQPICLAMLKHVDWIATNADGESAWPFQTKNDRMAYWNHCMQMVKFEWVFAWWLLFTTSGTLPARFYFAHGVVDPTQLTVRNDLLQGWTLRFLYLLDAWYLFMVDRDVTPIVWDWSGNNDMLNTIWTHLLYYEDVAAKEGDSDVWLTVDKTDMSKNPWANAHKGK